MSPNAVLQWPDTQIFAGKQIMNFTVSRKQQGGHVSCHGRNLNTIGNVLLVHKLHISIQNYSLAFGTTFRIAFIQNSRTGGTICG